MTTSVVVNVPKDAQYVAVVTIKELQKEQMCLVLPGTEKTFHVFQGKEVSVKEMSTNI